MSLTMVRRPSTQAVGCWPSPVVALLRAPLLPSPLAHLLHCPPPLPAANSTEWKSVKAAFYADNEDIKSATRELIDTSFRKLRSAEGACELLQSFKSIKSVASTHMFPPHICGLNTEPDQDAPFPSLPFLPLLSILNPHFEPIPSSRPCSLRDLAPRPSAPPFCLCPLSSASPLSSRSSPP